MTFSYMDFLDKPTPENVKAVHKACGMTQPQVANMLGIGLQTYKFLNHLCDGEQR